jgi:hypothetical protein
VCYICDWVVLRDLNSGIFGLVEKVEVLPPTSHAKFDGTARRD